MEKFVDAGIITHLLDITTTEVADHLFGGILTAGEDRLGVLARRNFPYLGIILGLVSLSVRIVWRFGYD